MNFDFDSIVIGAGVVGLAVARDLAISGRKVLLLEKCKGVGQGVSSRNSEVIHAGIYYPFDSLKRRFCVDGRKLLVSYCQDNKIDHKLLGKLIVANTKEQEIALSVIIKNGVRNGVTDLRMVSGSELEQLEPNLRATKAILSPSSGIVDSHSLMISMLRDFEMNGGLLSFGSSVSAIESLNSGFAVSIEGHDDFVVTSSELINSASFDSQSISSKISGINQNSIPKSFFCKGVYFSLATKSPFSRLIYPVPNSAGLGIHLTLDLAGRARFGPDVEWVNSPDYDVNNRRKDDFYKAIKEYFPEIKKDDLNPDYAGVRPKIVGANEPAADFMIQQENKHGLKGYIALYGIESPGLTASLAIGSYVRRSLDQPILEY